MLKMPPRIVPTPSAPSPARDRCLVDPASGDLAEREKHAVDSIITTIITMHMVTIGTN